MLKICDFSIAYLNYSDKWLNDEEIKFLTASVSFTKEEQRQWFESLKEKTDYFIFGLEYEGIPIGACGLKKITDIDCEFWGYIGEKEYWGKGLGKEMLTLMLNKAKTLKLKWVNLIVLTENRRALKLYEKYGFKIISEKNDIIIMTIAI